MITGHRCGFGLMMASLVSASVWVQTAVAQIYRPPRPYSMWDTWMFPDGDDYHLFFLQSEPGTVWNTLGRAVSKDLVHWTTLPPIPSLGPAGAWDHDPTLTGMTVKFGGQYLTFYGSATHGQKIGLMLSPDLKTWTKHPRNPTLTIKPPYVGTDWRDMCTRFDARENRWHGFVCAQTGEMSPRVGPIKDKTLVAWAYLGNTTQRGGSILTLDVGTPPGDVFDGIVFGERAEKRWMGGSNFYDRTPEDQSSWPAETAGPDTLVQIAVVYKGTEVTIYRNGQRYAGYTIRKPVEFGNGTSVVMGLRHLGATEKSSRFFAGAIEEARIYDVALDPAVVADLMPDKPSSPRPIGQWTFKDGSTRDEMGTFPNGELRGGAIVVNGKLFLDGQGACFATPTRGPAACIAHLVSKDLIDWEYLPPVFSDASFFDMEVPDYFELNGRHYLLFSSLRTRKELPGRKNATGVWYVMGDKREGPYRPPADCLILGSGNGRWDNYVGRTIAQDDTRLLYQHTCGGEVTWGVPKRVRQHDDGTLWLQYWPGLAKLETKVVLDGTSGLGTDSRTGQGTWTIDCGILRGSCPSDGISVLWLPSSPSEAMITCKIDLRRAQCGGMVWRWDGKRGAGITTNAQGDTATLVRAGATDKGGLSLGTLDVWSQLRPAQGNQHLRVMVRAHRAEVYLNDRWVFGASLPDYPPLGKIGLMVQSGEASFSDLRIAEIEPLPLPEK